MISTHKFFPLVIMILFFVHSLNGSTESQIDALKNKVERLPEHNRADAVKKAVLEIALERAKNALEVNILDESNALVQDVQNALTDPSDTFIQRNETITKGSLIKPLFTASNNPYLEGMLTDAKSILNKPDTVWPRTTKESPVFTDIAGNYGSRKQAQVVDDFIWLFMHEQSPMQYDAELLKRILRRSHALIDAYNLVLGYNNQLPIYDQFAFQLAFAHFYEISNLYPNLLLPSQKIAWDKAIEKERLRLSKPLKGKLNNINIETARMVGAMYVGLHTKDRQIIKNVITHTDRVLSFLKPDGAWGYHALGNPSVNYHDEVTNLLLIIYEELNYEPILETLEATQWKGPVMGKTDEFWTSPHFKTFRWNITRGAEYGSEAVIALSRNPYLVWMRNRFPVNKHARRLHVRFFKNDLEGIALPDNYTIPDRNTQGPRAWYGEFTYAGSFRDNPPGFYGHETLMGAMTVDKEDGRLNSVLTAITPRIWMYPVDESVEKIDVQVQSKHTERSLPVSAFGYLTSNENSATTISKNYSVGTSIHGISSSLRAAYQGPISDWRGRQLWIGLPDRMIGMVSTVPNKENPQAHALHGALRFISRGTAGAETLKHLEQISSNHYRYGQLDILIHHSNYNSVNTLTKEYRQKEFPASELIFSDRSAEPAPVGELKTYPADSEFTFIIEVKPIWTKEPVAVSHIIDVDLLCLEMIGEKRSIQVCLNVSSSFLQFGNLRARLPEGQASLVTSNGVLGINPFQTDMPELIDLAPGQHSVIIVSSDPDDHQPGWESFQDMVKN